MIHPYLKWLDQKRTCPNCWSGNVNYVGEDSTKIIIFECCRCDWKFQTSYADLMQTGLKQILLDTTEIIVIDENGNITSKDSFEVLRTDNIESND